MRAKGDPTTARAVRLPNEIWDEVEQASARRGTSVNAEVRRRVETAPAAAAPAGAAVCVTADSLGAMVAAVTALRGAGLYPEGTPRRGADGAYTAALRADGGYTAALSATGL